MPDMMLVILSALVIVPGIIAYYKLRKNYLKKTCTLKVEARIVERKKIISHGRGTGITIGGVFRPVFAVNIDGVERLITEKKRMWNDLQLEASPKVILWVNPENIEQFWYDDERLEHLDAGGYIFAGICIMIIAVTAVLSF